MATIHPLADVDPALIEQLIDLAFEPERRRRTATGPTMIIGWRFPAGSVSATGQHWIVPHRWPSSSSAAKLSVGSHSVPSRTL